MEEGIAVYLIDGIYCKVEKRFVNIVAPALTYERERRGADFGQGANITTEKACMIDRRNGRVLAGLLPRIMEAAEKKGYALYYPEGHPWGDLVPALPLDDTGLRGWQAQAVQSIVDYQRGYIIAPMGSGKTQVMITTAERFAGAGILVLCESIDLVEQTTTRFKQAGLAVQTIRGGKSRKLKADIVISTHQSFIKVPVEEYYNRFTVCLVDECHKFASLWKQILTNLMAPVKVGFTATPPPPGKALFLMEGLLGGVLYEAQMCEMEAAGYIAPVDLRLIPVPYNTQLTDDRRYKVLYKRCIINNRWRNGHMLRYARNNKEKGLTTLIMVQEVEHGNNLLAMAETMGLNVFFVHGNIKASTRETVRMQLNEKIIHIVIATTVWKEGIDIPTLDCFINGCGGKSEIKVLQTAGRALRRPEGKDKAIIVDFLDPYRYLAEHTILRLGVYIENKWLKA